MILVSNKNLFRMLIVTPFFLSAMDRKAQFEQEFAPELALLKKPLSLQSLCVKSICEKGCPFFVDCSQQRKVSSWSYFNHRDIYLDSNTELRNRLINLLSANDYRMVFPANAFLHKVLLHGMPTGYVLAFLKERLNETASVCLLFYENAGNMSPLQCAAIANNVQAMRLLIAAGADVNAKNSLGKTALHYTRYTCSDEAVTCLLQNGAVDTPDKKGKTALDLGMQRFQKDHKGDKGAVYPTYLIALMSAQVVQPRESVVSPDQGSSVSQHNANGQQSSLKKRVLHQSSDVLM